MQYKLVVSFFARLLSLHRHTRVLSATGFSYVWGVYVLKKYDVKVCAMPVVYSVNLKFKHGNLINSSLYTYLCIAICISADRCIL